jgi:putative hydrolase of the HAD superfamily
MALRRPRALLLDLDDTLLDHSRTSESVRRACELIASTFTGFDPPLLEAANDHVWIEYWPEIETLAWTGGMDGATASREAWRRTLLTCGSSDESIVEFAFERHQELEREARRPFPDVAEILACAAELDLRLGLVTNGPPDLQRDKLRGIGLAHSFDAIVISADIGAAKPDPAPFLAALEQLGLRPTDAWHVGDSLENDVGGALGAGITAVWLNRNGEAGTHVDVRPDLEIASLTDLADRLREPSG